MAMYFSPAFLGKEVHALRLFLRTPFPNSREPFLIARRFSQPGLLHRFTRICGLPLHIVAECDGEARSLGSNPSGILIYAPRRAFSIPVPPFTVKPDASLLGGLPLSLSLSGNLLMPASPPLKSPFR